MKVAIKWKGDELKYVDSGDLIISDNVTLTEYKKRTDDEITALKRTCNEQALTIAELHKNIEAVRLENIKIVEGLISR